MYDSGSSLEKATWINDVLGIHITIYNTAFNNGLDISYLHLTDTANVVFYGSVAKNTVEFEWAVVSVINLNNIKKNNNKLNPRYIILLI